MNIEQLKILLKDKNITELKSIIYDLHKKVPEVKDYLSISIHRDAAIVKQNTENLLKKYKRKIQDYIFPVDFETPTREEEAIKLIERIRKKEISPEFTIECELHYLSSCKDFILMYGYHDDEYYITMDEMFESACKKIKKQGLLLDYQESIEKLLAFGNEYGFEFGEICKDLKIYKTLV